MKSCKGGKNKETIEKKAITHRKKIAMLKVFCMLNFVILMQVKENKKKQKAKKKHKFCKMKEIFLFNF